MKKHLIPIGFIFLAYSSIAQQPGWKIVEGKIATPWAEKVNPSNPLSEYPRPQMVRGNWMSLNGLWDYAIKPQSESGLPA